jgi:hypothetical protein
VVFFIGKIKKIIRSKLKPACLKFSRDYDAAWFIMAGSKKKQPKFKSIQRKAKEWREDAAPYANGDAGREKFRFIDLFCGIGGFGMRGDTK